MWRDLGGGSIGRSYIGAGFGYHWFNGVGPRSAPAFRYCILFRVEEKTRGIPVIGLLSKMGCFKVSEKNASGKIAVF